MSDKKVSAVEVKKIILKIGDKSLELPIEEARELQRVLAELFGQPETRVVHEHQYPYWYWQPYPYTWIPCGTSASSNGYQNGSTVTITACNSTAKLLDG